MYSLDASLPLNFKWLSRNSRICHHDSPTKRVGKHQFLPSNPCTQSYPRRGWIITLLELWPNLLRVESDLIRTCGPVDHVLKDFVTKNHPEGFLMSPWCVKNVPGIIRSWTFVFYIPTTSRNDKDVFCKVGHSKFHLTNCVNFSVREPLSLQPVTCNDPMRTRKLTHNIKWGQNMADIGQTIPVRLLDSSHLSVSFCSFICSTIQSSNGWWNNK